VPLPAEAALGALVYGTSPGPRGLDPSTLAGDVLAAGGLELAGLAARLYPVTASPWYRAARAGEAAPWPEALSAVVAVWALAHGLDAEWLASASASLARLTHADAASVAGACLGALAACAVGETRSLKGLAARLPEWEPVARSWGGAAPSVRIRRAVGAATVHAGEPSAARAAAEAESAEPALAGALVGLVVGAGAGASEAGIASLAGSLAGRV
jgi:hypothetical protein